MKNLDLLKQKRDEIRVALAKAVSENNEEAFAQSFEGMMELIQEAVIEESKGAIQAADASILQGRGIRQLTSEENKYYQAVIEAMKSNNPQQALTDIDITLPKTVIDDVFEDLQLEHELLNAINFENTSGLIEILMNTDESQLATWGALTATITKELTSGFKLLSLKQNKLSAFLPIAKSMLDLGPAYIDKYVRAVLAEAIFGGIEEGAVNGTGKDMPIGMNRQVGDDVVVTGGVYPVKDTVAVTSFDPETYGTLLSTLAVTPTGKTRVINEVLLVVNPVDYYSKVMPATTIRNAMGQYINNLFPIPTKVVQSVAVPSGKAIFGLAKKYFMGIGTAKNGKIEYSYEYKFLEDQRVYAIKLYGHGQAKDDNAFLYLDISGLEPAVLEVYDKASEIQA